MAGLWRRLGATFVLSLLSITYRAAIHHVRGEDPLVLLQPEIRASTTIAVTTSSNTKQSGTLSLFQFGISSTADAGGY